MKKIKYILYLIPFFFILFFAGCITNELEVSSKITSVVATENSISFYETTTANLEITAKAILNCGGETVEEKPDITVNKTTQYSFSNLQPDTEYEIQILYQYESATYIKISSEKVKTDKPSTVDIEITCSDETFIYDGSPKSLNASIDGGFELQYEYSLNGQKIDAPVNVGEYQVKISFSGNDKYNPTSVERKLTIKPCEVNIPLENFSVDYQTEYEIKPNISMSYSIKYYQEDKELEEKPTLPGTYCAKIEITDSNYSGSKEIDFTINKLEYSLDYEDIFVLEGTPVSFTVEEFVDIAYYLNNQKVNTISDIGEYKVIFSFKDHPYYKDFTYEIAVVVDNKYRILIEAEDAFIETDSDYTISYKTNYEVDLNIKYYYDETEIAKPSQVGIYTVKLSYEEDTTYHSVEKTIQLYIYPKEQTIDQLTDGLYHIKGTVIGKDTLYSYVVNNNSILCVEDVSLEINSTYDIVGMYDSSGNMLKGSVLKKTKDYTQTVQPLNLSLIGFKEVLDSHLYQYVSLKGMVLLKENTYVLALEEDFDLELNSSFKDAYEKQTAVEVNMMFYGTKYIIFGFNSTELSDKEKVYAQALVYAFEDIIDALPLETTAPFETQIQYISSSNPEVIQIHPLKVIPPKQEDVKVSVTVQFVIGTNLCTKNIVLTILKEVVTELKIYSIEMHQQYGDSTLITYGDFDLLIDAGDQKDGPYVNKFLKEHISSDNHLDMIIVSHCHSDHMGGLSYMSSSDRQTKALDGISSIGTIVDYGHDRVKDGNRSYMHESWTNIRDSYVSKGAKYYPVYDCAKNQNGASSHFEIDNRLSFDFIDTMTYVEPAMNPAKTDFNIYSVATLLTFENFKFFFAGDLENEGEYNLYNNYLNTPLKDITNENVVLYKAAHHGTDPGKSGQATISKDGGNQLQFLKLIKPDYFFASAAMCSGDNFQSSEKKFIGGQPHPYPKALANFRYFSDEIYFNGTNGTLEFITDGLEMKSIHGYGATTNYLLEAGGNLLDYASQADLRLIDTLWYDKFRKKSVQDAYNKIKDL